MHWHQNYQLYRKYLQNIIVLYQKRQDLKIFTELLLTLATVFIFGIFAIKPTLVTIAELYKEKKNKEEIILKMDQKISSLTQAEAFYDQAKEQIYLLNLAIPDQPLPESFVRQTEGLARKNNVTLTGLSVTNAPLIGQGTPSEQPPAFEDAQSFPVSLEATGNYFSLLSLLSDLELTRRPLSPQELKFSLINEEGATDLTLSLSGFIIYLK